MMRFNIFLLSIAIFCCFSPGLSMGEETIKGEEIGVRALMQNPDNYPGQMTVIGVVSQVLAEAHLIGLIDVEEFKDCKKVTCASLILPIRWNRTMPEIGDRLTVTGSITKEGKRYLFVATALEVVPAD